MTVSPWLSSVRTPVFRWIPISWKMSGSAKSLMVPWSAIYAQTSPFPPAPNVAHEPKEPE